MDMARFHGILVKDDDGALCLKMKLAPQNPNFEEIPLEELMEEFMGKSIVMDVFALEPRWKEEAPK